MMKWQDQFTHYRQKANEFLFGAALSWVIVPLRIKRRAEMERIFALILTMQLRGMPLLPSSYMLKLLPYMMPNLMYWKRMTVFDKILEEVDLRHIGH